MSIDRFTALDTLLHPNRTVYDTVIVGGGPAGLSAALVLGRCRRRVLLCDSGTPRNARSRELHGYLTRDGIAPMELLRLGREELPQYGIETRHVGVTKIHPVSDRFDISLADGVSLESRTVLIASGLMDEIPDIPGLHECFGTTVHHCPYCDGWEVRDKSLVVLGHRTNAAGLALALKTWSDRVTLCSNGPARLLPPHREQIARHRIDLRETRVSAIAHEAGHVRAVEFAKGEALPCDAVFIAAGQRQQSPLARDLGCLLTRRGLVKADRLGQAGIAGVYVAGDASRDVQFAIVAAAEGAKAAVAINKALQERAGLAVAV